MIRATRSIRTCQEDLDQRLHYEPAPSLSELKGGKFISMYTHINIYRYLNLCHMLMQSQRERQIPWRELELTVSHPMWVQGTELRSSERGNALNQLSLQPLFTLRALCIC